MAKEQRMNSNSSSNSKTDSAENEVKENLEMSQRNNEGVENHSASDFIDKDGNISFSGPKMRGPAKTFLSYEEDFQHHSKLEIDEMIGLASNFEAGGALDHIDLDEYKESYMAFDWRAMQHPLYEVHDTESLRDWRESLDSYYQKGRTEAIKKVDLDKNFSTVSVTNFTKSESTHIFVTTFKKGFYSLYLQSASDAHIKNFLSEMLEIHPSYAQVMLTVLLEPTKVFDCFMQYVETCLSSRQIENMKDKSRILNFSAIVQHFSSNYRVSGVEHVERAPLIASLLACVIFRNIFQIEMVAPFNFVADLGVAGEEIADLREVYALEKDVELAERLVDFYTNFDLSKDTKDGRTLASLGARLSVVGLEAIIKDRFNREKVTDLDAALVAWLVLIKRHSIPTKYRDAVIKWESVPGLESLSSIFQIEVLSVNDLNGVINYSLDSLSSEEGLNAVKRFVDFINGSHKFMSLVPIKEYVQNKYDLCVTRAIDGSVRGVEVLPKLFREERFSSFFISKLDGLTRLSKSENTLLDAMSSNFTSSLSNFGLDSLETIKRLFAPDLVVDGLISTESILSSKEERVLIAKGLGLTTLLYLPFKLEVASSAYLSLLHKVGIIQLTEGVTHNDMGIGDGDVDTRLRNLISSNLHEIAFEMASFAFEIDCYNLRIQNRDLRPYGRSFITSDENLALIVAVHKFLPEGDIQYYTAKPRPIITTVPPIKDRVINIPSSDAIIGSSLFQPRNIRVNLWGISLHLPISMARMLNMRYRGMMSFFMDPARYAYQGYLINLAEFYIELTRRQFDELSPGDSAGFYANEEIECGKRLLQHLGDRVRTNEMYGITKQFLSQTIYRKLATVDRYQERKNSYSIMNFTDNYIGMLAMCSINEEILCVHPDALAYILNKTTSLPVLASSVRL